MSTKSAKATGKKKIPLLAYAEPEQAGFAIPSWCRAVGIGVSSFYQLGAELRPASVKVGDRRLVIESPQAYLQRIASQQQQAEVNKS
jgi:hypothetical protein